MKRKLLLLSIALALVGLLAFVGIAQRTRDFSEEFLANPSGSALTQIFSTLKNDYLNKIDDAKVTQGAIHGAIEALDDPFTYYVDPQTTKMRDEDLSGSFEGIGALLQVLNRQTGKGVKIVNVYKDGPAWNAGILPGDIFYKVDGQNVEDKTPSEVARVVRGPKGTTVHLEMIRAGEKEPVVIDIVRGHIDIISVESAVIGDHIGYISLKTFANEKLYDQMVKQLDDLKARGIKGLVLDLRDNGGGLLNQGILVADEFLSEGNIVFKRAKGVTQRIARADANSFDLPMVVLVNKNSASASEIVAGALQDNGRAKIVGETTFGKGVAQNVINLVDQGQLAYVVFEWLTPNKRSIHKVGIKPDVEAKDTRYPSVVSLEGFAEPGKKIDISVDGEKLGSTIADKEGKFKFVSSIADRNYSAVQGRAVVDLETDSALKTAYETVLLETAN